MRLKDVKLKENESLFIGYFDNDGKEVVIGRRIQKLSGAAFEMIQKNLGDLDIEKVKGGYATSFVKRYLK